MRVSFEMCGSKDGIGKWNRGEECEIDYDVIRQSVKNLITELVVKEQEASAFNEPIIRHLLRKARL